MTDPDEFVVALSAAVLRGADFEIEALSLEGIAEDAVAVPLDQALASASLTQAKGGDFGMAIAGAVLIPIVVEAVKQFWEGYQKELIKEAGAQAAKWTLAQLRLRFSAPNSEAANEKLADALRQVGHDRGLRAEDIEALVAAAAPSKLTLTLAVG